MTIDNDDNSSAYSLATPRPLEDDNAAAAPPPRGTTFSELWYVGKNRSLKALAILSLGLKNPEQLGERERGRESKRESAADATINHNGEGERERGRGRESERKDATINHN